MSKKSKRKAAKKVKLVSVKLPVQGVVRVEAPKAHLPVVTQPRPGVIEIAPVAKKPGWWRSLWEA